MEFNIKARKNSTVVSNGFPEALLQKLTFSTTFVSTTRKLANLSRTIDKGIIFSVSMLKGIKSNEFNFFVNNRKIK